VSTLAPPHEPRVTIRRRGLDDVEQQLWLASQVQRDLLPDPMPRSTTAAFHGLFLPADRVSGDIYDVVRLDEDTLGVSIADATGHGIPAALLTVFIKRGFRGKTIENGSYRILEPDEVLHAMNRDLLDTRLSHCQFVTAAHAVYNERTRTVRFARGGLPYPVWVRPGCEPRLLRSTGVLLGAVEKPPLDIVEMTLEPGDRLFFYTDGLEALLCGRRPGEDPFDLSITPWFRALPDRPTEQALEDVAAIRRSVSPDAWPVDDITLVTVDAAA
jgi:sigma-B regulation protein RsbU (phosphoserine phosphatase)